MNRYYFMGFIVVDGCNPNGDPTAENRPRIDYEGHGEISSVSIKRKIRDALCFEGEDIFVRDDITADGFESQRKRAGLISAGGLWRGTQAPPKSCGQWRSRRKRNGLITPSSSRRSKTQKWRNTQYDRS